MLNSSWHSILFSPLNECLAHKCEHFPLGFMEHDPQRPDADPFVGELTLSWTHSKTTFLPFLARLLLQGFLVGAIEVQAACRNLHHFSYRLATAFSRVWSSGIRFRTSLCSTDFCLRIDGDGTAYAIFQLA